VTGYGYTVKNMLADLRTWWRWRMRRAKVHIPALAEYRNVGVVMDRDDTCWRIVDDEGRTFLAPVVSSKVPDVNVGDRVEIEPFGPSTAGTRLSNRNWLILRKVESAR